jgi:hypothetical protein
MQTNSDFPPHLGAGLAVASWFMRIALMVMMLAQRRLQVGLAVTAGVLGPEIFGVPGGLVAIPGSLRGRRRDRREIRIWRLLFRPVRPNPASDQRGGGFVDACAAQCSLC